MSISIIALAASLVAGDPNATYYVVHDYACAAPDVQAQPESFDVQVAGRSVVVTHRWVKYNCGLAFGVDIHYQGGGMILYETQTGEDQDCKCIYPEIRYEIHNFERGGVVSGNFAVTIFRVGEFRAAWSGMFTVGEKTRCASGVSLEKPMPPGDPPEEEVIMTPERWAIRIEHRNVVTQCCVQVAHTCEIDGNRIRVALRDVGPPCDCVGLFDIWAVVGDLGVGTYEVTFEGLGGRTVTQEVSFDIFGLAFFVRGDANGDGLVNVADPVFILLYAFAGGRAPAVLDSADVNDDARIDLGDAIGLLNYLFQGGPPPAHPFPRPGFDTTPDKLD